MIRATMRVALAIIALTLCACGGGSGTGAIVPARPSGAPGATGRLSVTLQIPVLAQTAARPRFIVAQTNGMTVALTPQGSTQPSVTVAFDVSPSSKICSTSGTTRTCTLAIPAPAGTTYTVVFTSYDTAPVNGTIPSSAKVLGSATTTATITAGQLNTISVTINGAPATITLNATSVAVLGGAASTVALAPSVHDAAGNTILGGYATPISVSVSETGGHTLLSINGGTTKAATVQLASSTDAANLTAYFDGGGSAGYVATISFTAGGVATVNATLNRFSITGSATFGTPTFTSGAPSSAAFSAPAQQLTLTASEPNFSGTFSVKSNTCSGIAAVGSTAPAFAVTSTSFGTCAVTITDGTLNAVVNVAANVTHGGVVIPPPTGTVEEYSDSIASLQPTGITTGSDGNLWFVGATSVGYISRVTPSGTITDFALPSPYINPVAIASGFDGNLWVLELSTDAVLVVNTSGTIVTTHALAGGANPFGIALGSDGAMWITNSRTGTITCFASGGTSTTYSIPNGGAPTAIAAGPDGAMWFGDAFAGQFGRVTTPCTAPGGGVFTIYSVPDFSGVAGLTTGPDRALWFTETVTSSVGRLTTAGVYSDQGTLTHAPSTNIVVGPDLNLWYGACGCPGAPDFIYRLTPAGTLTPFNGGVTTANVDGVTVGPDGAIWYAGDTATDTTVIGRLQP